MAKLIISRYREYLRRMREARSDPQNYGIASLQFKIQPRCSQLTYGCFV